MEISCDKCHIKFKIPDEKVPPGKIATLRCPKCKEKITIGQVPSDDPYTALETYDAFEKPFDFVEEEGKTALVCESDPGLKESITKSLATMEYHITDAGNGRDALKKMRYHDYDLILVNEDFDTTNPDANGILIYLERLSMSQRRNLFVVMISNRFRTMDHMMAFNKSVNVIINVSNIKDIDKILRRSITDNDFFYRLFREMMRKTGRI